MHCELTLAGSEVEKHVRGYGMDWQYGMSSAEFVFLLVGSGLRNYVLVGSGLRDYTYKCTEFVIVVPVHIRGATRSQRLSLRYSDGSDRSDSLLDVSWYIGILGL